MPEKTENGKNGEKKTLILTWAAILSVILVTVGATYAYFQANMGEGQQAELKAQTSTTDVLTFEVSSKSGFTIHANYDNFAMGMENLKKKITASATLIANNNTNTATATYGVYLNINQNTFIYTTGEENAEILLQVKKPDGTMMTDGEIPSLDYVTIKGESGFDITQAQDALTIYEDYVITATNKKTDDWEISIVLINLDTNQKDNEGKIFDGRVSIEKKQSEEETLES